MNKKYGPETQKNHIHRIESGFYEKYMSGIGIDVGYRGEHGDDNILPAPNCIGIDLNYPGYNGKILPFEDMSIDFVFTSHVYEHISDWKTALTEWHRVIKIGGYIVIIVPHLYLYERKWKLPSDWNPGGHLRFYTPARLLSEIETSLKPNSYRIRSLRDNDTNYNYTIKRPQHAAGSYEIELVIQKILKPEWDIE